MKIICFFLLICAYCLSLYLRPDALGSCASWDKSGDAYYDKTCVAMLLRFPELKIKNALDHSLQFTSPN